MAANQEAAYPLNHLTAICETVYKYVVDEPSSPLFRLKSGSPYSDSEHNYDGPTYKILSGEVMYSTITHLILIPPFYVAAISSIRCQGPF